MVARYSICAQQRRVQCAAAGPQAGLEYREGDHVLRVGVERAVVDVAWIIYLGSIAGWMPPYQHEPVSEEKRQQIRERVIAALDFLKIKYYLPK